MEAQALLQAGQMLLSQRRPNRVSRRVLEQGRSQKVSWGPACHESVFELCRLLPLKQRSLDPALYLYLCVHGDRLLLQSQIGALFATPRLPFEFVLFPGWAVVNAEQGVRTQSFFLRLATSLVSGFLDFRNDIAGLVTHSQLSWHMIRPCPLLIDTSGS